VAWAGLSKPKKGIKHNPVNAIREGGHKEHDGKDYGFT
jgi:hypothetical protein